MKIIPKSSERVSAQVAEFAHTSIEPDKRNALLRYAARIATNKPSELSELERSTTHDSYLSFLRKGQDELQHDIDFFEEMLQAYPTYETEITELRKELSTMENPKAHPQFLGDGQNANAFWFDHEDRRLVARIPHRPDGHPAHEHMRAFTKGNKIPNLQTLVAASPEGNVIVTELLPGKNANKLNLEDCETMPDEHIANAIKLLIKMNEAGLGFDPKAENMMYDKATGFSILDYSRQDESSTNTPPKDIMYFSYVVAPPPSKERSNDATITQQNETLLERFYTVLQQTSPELTETVKQERSSRDAVFNKIPTIDELMSIFAEPADDFYE